MESPVHEHRIAAAGHLTRALEVTGNGPGIVLLHGWSDSADTWRPLLRTAGAWERIGRRIGPRFAGAVIIEAAKDMYAAIPAAEGAPARRRVVSAIDSG